MGELEEKKLSHKGTVYQYCDVNPEADGPVLVLLHGIAVDKGWWTNRYHNLRFPGRKIIPDLPGHKDLPMDTIETMDDAAEYFREFFDVLELEKVLLVGYSLGGLVTLKFGEMYGDDEILERFLVWSSPFLGMEGVAPDGMQLITLIKRVPGPVYDLRSKSKLVELLSKWKKVDMDQHQIEALGNFPSKPAKKWISIIETTEYDLEPRLSAKMIFGTDDILVNMKNYEYALEHRGENLEVVLVPEGGHFGSEEGMKKSYAEIDEFLEKVGNKR